MAKLPRKVLVIEDDLSMIKVLEKWLPVAGYETQRTMEGQLGVEKAKEYMPDMEPK